MYRLIKGRNRELVMCRRRIFDDLLNLRCLWREGWWHERRREVDIICEEVLKVLKKIKREKFVWSDEITV